MASKRDYNGLRQGSVPFGGQVHDLSRRQPTQEEMEALISQQLQVLAREIYVRGAVEEMFPIRDDVAKYPAADIYRYLAQQCQIAAKAYFESMGVQFTPDEQSEPDSLA